VTSITVADALVNYPSDMDTEPQICRFYEAEMAAIAALDRGYYLTQSPTVADRRAYAIRQAQLDKIRARFFTELARIREQCWGPLS